MRAVAVTEYGGIPQLLDLPVPEPGPNELLVRLRAAAFNPFDKILAAGLVRDRVTAAFPLVYGQDGAGVVEAVGPAVTGYRPGDEVYGNFMDPPRGIGSYAEYAVIDAGGPVARMPRGMIFEQAAAVPLAAATGQAFVDAAQVDTGQRVLVVGATGGMGQAAVQFAALAGAEVVATTRPELTAMLTGLGARGFVDFTAGPVAAQAAVAYPDGFNAVLDAASYTTEATDELASLLVPGGVLVSANNAADVAGLAERELRGVNIWVRNSAELLGRVADLIDAGELKFLVQEQIMLADAPAMLQATGRKSRGKLVIRI